MKEQATINAKPSPKVKRRARRMSPEERRVQILSCSVEVFSEKGINVATHADVASRACVSIPTVFHYYPSIEELQMAVLDDVYKFLVDGFVKNRFDSDKAALTLIEEMLLDFREAVGKNREYITIWLEWSGVTRGRTWDFYMEFYRETIQSLRKLILQGRKDGSICSKLNATETARVILGMAHTIAHMCFSGVSNKAVQHLVHTMVISLLSPKSDLKPSSVKVARLSRN